MSIESRRHDRTRARAQARLESRYLRRMYPRIEAAVDELAATWRSLIKGYGPGPYDVLGGPG